MDLAITTKCIKGLCLNGEQWTQNRLLLSCDCVKINFPIDFTSSSYQRQFQTSPSMCALCDGNDENHYIVNQHQSSWDAELRCCTYIEIARPRYLLKKPRRAHLYVYVYVYINKGKQLFFLQKQCTFACWWFNGSENSHYYISLGISTIKRVAHFDSKSKCLWELRTICIVNWFKFLF